MSQAARLLLAILPMTSVLVSHAQAQKAAKTPLSRLSQKPATVPTAPSEPFIEAPFPNNRATIRAVNQGFISWARIWALPPYTVDSATIDRFSTYGNLNTVVGSFVSRNSLKPTRMPYRAIFDREGEAYTLSALCIENEPGTKPEFECLSAIPTIEARVAQLEKERNRPSSMARDRSRSSDDALEPRTRQCRRDYSYGTPGMLGYEDNGAMGRGIPTEICD